ncbi:MAG: UDP-glucose 4-epimerase GalE [Betaproteobacteria bacterium]|nr:UDP-glucose 4-epimerase GalE [Betaproteobacteria bacterium]
MKTSTFLVIGGAGYIGSHLVKALIEQEHRVLVVDNLSAGKASAVLGGELLVHDFDDRAFLDSLFKTHQFDGVFHFASQIVVSESVKDPGKYYRANTAATLTLLEAMRDHDVGPLVFSSTAAVYGEPQYTPIDENHPTNAVNPYGRSKLMVEQMLQDFANAYQQQYVALRYFNAAGADPQARIGEQHNPETHLIPLALQAITGKCPPLQLFGQDYDTPDGTCIRDYIHVDDLASAHILAMNYLINGGDSGVFNIGNGQGYSVNEVIQTASKVAEKQVPVTYAPRRAGDPARLVADANRAKQVLGWQPKYADLTLIIQHAWAWEKSRH